jgi:hypothetical protein
MEDAKQIDELLIALIDEKKELAMISMGLIENPVTSENEIDLVFARQCIDTLDMLKEKTVGNLNPEQEQILTGIIQDLKLKFVEVAQETEPED